jgi:hypothetical protein
MFSVAVMVTEQISSDFDQNFAKSNNQHFLLSASRHSPVKHERTVQYKRTHIFTFEETFCCPVLPNFDIFKRVFCIFEVDFHQFDRHRLVKPAKTNRKPRDLAQIIC